jgi:hypothetical protein
MALHHLRRMATCQLIVLWLLLASERQSSCQADEVAISTAISVGRQGGLAVSSTVAAAVVAVYGRTGNSTGAQDSDSFIERSTGSFGQGSTSLWRRKNKTEAHALAGEGRGGDLPSPADGSEAQGHERCLRRARREAQHGLGGGREMQAAVGRGSMTGGGSSTVSRCQRGLHGGDKRGERVLALGAMKYGTRNGSSLFPMYLN